MNFSVKDVVPLSQARARLSELADEVKSGTEKLITKNGESYVALIDADKLDHYHRLEREFVFVALANEVKAGMSDVASGRYRDLRATRALLRRKLNAPKRRK